MKVLKESEHVCHYSHNWSRIKNSLIEIEWLEYILFTCIHSICISYPYLVYGVHNTSIYWNILTNEKSNFHSSIYWNHFFIVSHIAKMIPITCQYNTVFLNNLPWPKHVRLYRAYLITAIKCMNNYTSLYNQLLHVNLVIIIR